MEQKMPKKSRKQAKRKKKNQYLKYNITIKYALLNEIRFVFFELVQNRKEKINISKYFNISIKHNVQKKNLDQFFFPKLEWTKNQIIEK